MRRLVGWLRLIIMRRIISAPPTLLIGPNLLLVLFFVCKLNLCDSLRWSSNLHKSFSVSPAHNAARDQTQYTFAILDGVSAK